jgi:hypothetical protein
VSGPERISQRKYWTLAGADLFNKGLNKSIAVIPAGATFGRPDRLTNWRPLVGDRKAVRLFVRAILRGHV